MNESYVECLVAKKPSSAMKALQVFLIVLAVIFFLLSMLNALMWLGVAAAGIGAYLLRSMPAWSLNICTWIRRFPSTRF